MASRTAAIATTGVGDTYRLGEQVGFLIRRAHQRHTALFAARIGDDLTTTQWAALARLRPGPARRTNSAATPPWTSPPSRAWSTGW